MITEMGNFLSIFRKYMLLGSYEETLKNNLKKKR